MKHRLKDEVTNLEEWYDAIVTEVSAILKYEEYNEELI